MTKKHLYFFMHSESMAVFSEKGWVVAVWNKTRICTFPYNETPEEDWIPALDKEFKFEANR